MRVDLTSSNAVICQPPSFAIGEQRQPTPAQRNGLRYEEKALTYLEGWAGRNGYCVYKKVWIQYRDLLGRVRYCQPDAYLLSQLDDNLIVAEVKLHHTRDAFQQLRLYRGLLGELYPKNTISGIEICHNFDPSEFKTTLFPDIRPHDLPHAAVMWQPLRAPLLDA